MPLIVRHCYCDPHTHTVHTCSRWENHHEDTRIFTNVTAGHQKCWDNRMKIVMNYLLFHSDEEAMIPPLLICLIVDFSFMETLCHWEGAPGTSRGGQMFEKGNTVTRPQQSSSIIWAYRILKQMPAIEALEDNVYFLCLTSCVLNVCLSFLKQMEIN